MRTQDCVETSVFLDNDICPTTLASEVSLSIIIDYSCSISIKAACFPHQGNLNSMQFKELAQVQCPRHGQNKEITVRYIRRCTVGIKA